MLHLAKLSVGTRDLTHMRALQQARASVDPPLRHRTRNFPRRAAEILQGGSIYWVIQGAMSVRQPLLDIIEDRLEDGSPCAGLVLAPTLIPVVPRIVKPFQGWRYLAADAAPSDLDTLPHAEGEGALPDKLRAELRSLGLL